MNSGSSDHCIFAVAPAWVAIWNFDINALVEYYDPFPDYEGFYPDQPYDCFEIYFHQGYQTVPASTQPGAATKYPEL